MKIIDFGIAKAAGKITRTQAGMIKGKAGYMSPEQIQGQGVDRRADIFALGICLWEALTSQRLFDGPNELVVMEKIRSGQVTPPSRLNPRVPSDLDRAVLKALAKDPIERYATASEFEADLRSCAARLAAPGNAARVAALMSQMFPEEAARSRAAGQESNRMSEKGGSDLDVFNGLAKKSAPAGPTSDRRAPPPVKKTLLGLQAPPPPMSRPVPSRPPSLPTPPPSRRSGPGPGPLPSRPLPPPPSMPRSPSGRPGPVPPKPPPAAAAPVDMDWDDEDEKTAIFDKHGPEDAASALLRSGPPQPAAGAPASGQRLGAGTAALLSGSGGAAPPSAGNPPWSGPRPSGGPGMQPPGMQPPGMHPGMQQQQQQSMQPQQQSMQPMPQQAPAPAMPYPAAQPSGGSGKTILLALAALLAVGLIAALVVFMLPRQGSLVVTVAGPGNKPVDAVQVFVDGNKKCDTSPCRVTEIKSGTHMVKVTAAGYQPTADQAVKVASGEDAVINVTLVRASEGTGIRVTAETSGAVKLFVDGKEIGPLPQELKDMTPGEHVIKVAGDRYEPWEKRVNVEADQLQTLEPKLKVVKGLATIKLGSDAAGARVLLVSGGERRPIPKLPIKVDITTDKPWSIVATKSGYDDFKKDIVFEDGKAEETFVIDMNEKGKPKPPDTGKVAGTGPKPGPGPGPGPKPTATSTPTPTGQGTLNINSIPVSNVILDGRPLGTTPKVGISVSAGNHTVVFIHAEHGRKVRSVSVKPGGTATAAVRFP